MGGDLERPTKDGWKGDGEEDRVISSCDKDDTEEIIDEAKSLSFSVVVPFLNSLGDLDSEKNPEPTRLGKNGV